MRIPRHKATFYFFPAFLPLLELIPFLLGLIATVAGLASFNGKAFWQKYRRLFFVIGLSGFAVAGFYYASKLPSFETMHAGTRRVPPKEYPKPIYFSAPDKARPETSDTFEKAWSVHIGPQVLSTPEVFDDVLVFGAFDGSVEAISTATGSRLWSLPGKELMFTLTKGPDGRLYAGEGMHETKAALLSAIDPESGKLFWQRELGGHIEAPASIDTKTATLYTSAGPGGLWAIGTMDGKVRWHNPLGHIDAQALLHENRLYIPAQLDVKGAPTVFYALDAKTGDVVWQLEQPGSPWGSPLIDGTGTIILTTTGLGQIGVKRDTDKGWSQGISLDGKLIWETKLPTMVIQPSLYYADGDMVIHALKNGVLYAQNAKTGAKIWEAQAGAEFRAGPALNTDFNIPLVAATSNEGVFTLRDARTGKELFRAKGDDNVSGGPVFSGDRVYTLSAHRGTAYHGLSALAGGAK
jgi:outer membrane protein assembly factor BamB